jgi:hypothetical protein
VDIMGSLLRRAMLLAAVALLIPAAAATAADTTTTSLTGPATHPLAGEHATITAQVTNQSTSAEPTGTVQFRLDGKDIGGPVPLVAHQASVDTPALTAGDHTIDAHYTADSGFTDSDGTLALTVDKAPTALVLTSIPASAVGGERVGFWVRVTPSSGGTVTITLPGGSSPALTLDANGTATWSTYPETTGAQTVTATYSGTDVYAASTATWPLTVTPARTSIALTSSANPAEAGRAVTFTASVDSEERSDFWPSGILTFTAEGLPILRPFALDGGETITFVGTNLEPGTHVIGAHFAGDPWFQSSDAALSQVVNAPPPAPAPTPTPPVVAPPVVAQSGAPRGLTIKATPTRDRRRPYRFALSGKLVLPTGVSRASGCSGRVTVTAVQHRKRVARKVTSLRSTCAWKATLTVPKKGTVSLTAAFAGNARVAALTTKAMKVRAG